MRGGRPEYDPAEVVYQSSDGEVREHDTLLVESGFPAFVVRAGKRFRLVAHELVASSGKPTCWRARYREDPDLRT